MVRGLESIRRVIILFVLFLGCIGVINAQKRPVIGVSDASKDGKNAAVPRSYIEAVLQAGGIPVVIPMMYDEKKVIELLNSLDGIIFAGGGDFDPAYYNERPIPQMGKINVPRDEFEMKLVHLAAERNIPVLGICRGLQLINIAFGGSLYQDLPAQYYDNSIKHRQKQPNEESSHAVYVEEHTVFADIVEERMLMVNSSHHQAIKKVAQGFRVAGKSPDEIVEVIEKVDDENWILGVQFHPEARITRDKAMRRIFQRFIDEAGSQEKPDRSIKTVSVPKSQRKYEPDSEPQIKRESAPDKAPTPQIIHKSVIDTQFIYKFVKDTQYIYAPADTVYISVSDTKYIQMPTDTVYVSDTVYISVPEKASSAPVSGTPELSPVPNKSKSGRVKPTSSSDKSKADTVKSTVPVSDIPTSASHQSVSDTTQSVSDAFIFIPGTSGSTEESAKTDTRAKKKEEKEKAKKAKKEAEEKKQLYQKEQIEKARQNKKTQKEKELQERKALKDKEEQQKKEQKEQAEKEKWAKKEAKEKEKQFEQQQKESEKLDKQELKKMEEQKKTAESSSIIG